MRSNSTRSSGLEGEKRIFYYFLLAGLLLLTSFSNAKHTGDNAQLIATADNTSHEEFDDDLIAGK